MDHKMLVKWSPVQFASTVAEIFCTRSHCTNVLGSFYLVIVMSIVISTTYLL